MESLLALIISIFKLGAFIATEAFYFCYSQTKKNSL